MAAWSSVWPRESRQKDRSVSLNAVYQLVLHMLARCFAFGREAPGLRQILARTGRCEAGPAGLA
jgi:hypothetical protein